MTDELLSYLQRVNQSVIMTDNTSFLNLPLPFLEISVQGVVYDIWLALGVGQNSKLLT